MIGARQGIIVYLHTLKQAKMLQKIWKYSLCIKETKVCCFVYEYG